MPVPAREQLGRFDGWLDDGTVSRLTERVRRAARGGRRQAPARLVSVTAQLGDIDPSALVFASRRPGEPWFCFEQPDRDGSAVAGLGCAHRIEAAGDQRFAAVARRWEALCGDSLHDPRGLAPGSGLAAFGGFSFAPAQTAGGPWAAFAPASLIVPELALCRDNGTVSLTVNVEVSVGEDPSAVLDRLSRRLAALRIAGLPLLDPEPAVAPVVRSALPPVHYEEAVARAVERIRAGEFKKVVLAREVEIQAPVPYDPAALFGVLREAFASCYVYAVGRGEDAFIGATPELLIRREGQRVSTVALAGSTRRSADPAVDAHLGEQLLVSAKNLEENAIVAQRIREALLPHSVWVTATQDPALIKVANVQHLAAPIRAQLGQSVSAIELAGLLHPTPAVGGDPSDVALAAIPGLEGMDRGWYAGPVGWVDTAGDGEFCVALRCALLRGDRASCYAGCGVVADSDPAAELAETETKLQAVLPLLAA